MQNVTPLEVVLRRDRTIVLAGLTGVAALAWAYTLYLARNMRGMDMGSMPMGPGMSMPQMQSWGAGDFVLTFSGNSFQKPFELGSYLPRFEPPYGSSEKLVSVTFRTQALPDHRLKTIDQSTGAVTIETGPGGAKTIRVDVSVIKYEG